MIFSSHDTSSPLRCSSQANKTLVSRQNDCVHRQLHTQAPFNRSVCLLDFLSGLEFIHALRCRRLWKQMSQQQRKKWQRSVAQAQEQWGRECEAAEMTAEVSRSASLGRQDRSPLMICLYCCSACTLVARENGLSRGTRKSVKSQRQRRLSRTSS